MPDFQVEVYVREVIQVVSKVLILTKKEPRWMCIWSDRTRFSKFNCKRIPPNGEVV